MSTCSSSEGQRLISPPSVVYSHVEELDVSVAQPEPAPADLEPVGPEPAEIAQLRSEPSSPVSRDMMADTHSIRMRVLEETEGKMNRIHQLEVKKNKLSRLTGRRRSLEKLSPFLLSTSIEEAQRNGEFVLRSDHLKNRTGERLDKIDRFFGRRKSFGDISDFLDVAAPAHSPAVNQHLRGARERPQAPEGREAQADRRHLRCMIIHCLCLEMQCTRSAPPRRCRPRSAPVPPPSTT